MDMLSMNFTIWYVLRKELANNLDPIHKPDERTQLLSPHPKFSCNNKPQYKQFERGY